MTAQSPAIRSAPGPRSAMLRSKVTNGRALFVQGDGRSPWARRWRDLVELHAADVCSAELLSEAQLSLCRRIATIEIELEAMEGRLSEGETVDLDVYARAAGHLRRMLETLNNSSLNRKARNVGPSLGDLLRDDQRVNAG